MKIHSYIPVLTIIVYMTLISTALAEDDTSESHSFSERIITLQNETLYLCSDIEQKLLVATKQFKTLMRDAHIHCPDNAAMGKTLANIEAKANQYYSFVIEKLNGCQELSNMLTKGLENGGLVAFYLMEGNYTLVTRILDKWHGSFTKFRASFDLMDTPLEIMLQNTKVFYDDNLTAGIFQFIAIWGVILIISIVLSLFMIIKIDSTLGYSKKLNQPITPIHEEQSALNKNSSQTTIVNTNLNEVNQQVRKRNKQQQYNSNEGNNVSTTTIQLKFSQFETFFKILLWFVVFCAVTAIAQSWYPTVTFFPKPVRRNWFPDATTTLNIMNTNNDNLQSNLSRQIRSIEELQSHASMYHDKTVQTNVNELVRTLATGVRQASTELANVYTLSEKMPSTLRRTYKRIEEKATKAGRLSESHDLLVALNESSDKYEELQRSVRVLVTHQQKLLPILKEQTQSMQALVQEGRLVEIGRIINYHKDVLMDIDGNTYKVQIKVKEIIDIVSNDGIDGMKKIIESLQTETSTDQIKAMVYGALGAGTAATPMLGMLALKSGYAIVTVTATAVASPVLIAGAAGMIGLGTLCALTNFNGYLIASHYKNELAELEIERVNFKVAMEQLNKAVTEQQQALESSQKSLTSIAQYSGEFSKISGFTLNREQRNGISDELLTIIRQYNRMIAFHDLFTKNMDKKRQALPSA